MAELATLARPYAEAVFDLAKESGDLDVWSKTLAFLSTVIDDSTMAAVIANPRVTKEQLVNILLDVGSEALDDQAKNLVKMLVDNNRVAIVPALAVLFEQLRAEAQGRVQVEVSSAYALSDSQQQELGTVLEKRLGKAVDISVKIDDSLTGGFIVHADNKVIDVSLRGRLEQVAAELRS